MSGYESKIAMETKLSSLNYSSFPVRFYESLLQCIFFVKGIKVITFNLFFIAYPVDLRCITSYN